MAQRRVSSIVSGGFPSTPHLLQGGQAILCKEGSCICRTLDRRIKITDDAILSGVFHEKVENELQKLSLCDKAATNPRVNAASSVSPAVVPVPTKVALIAPTSDASSTIGSASETKLPDGKTRDTTAWYKELKELAKVSTAYQKGARRALSYQYFHQATPPFPHRPFHHA